MTVALVLVLLFVIALILLAVASHFGARRIERQHPPVGQFIEIGDASMHHVHLPASGAVSLPPVVFIHGASGNLKDQLLPFSSPLEGGAEMLFLDRPGHGWSTRGTTNETPHGQAATISALMEHLGIERAVIVGHSFGAAIAATLAIDFPQKVAGLVFMSAASHPWPGGRTSWYYGLARTPIIGRLFAHTLAWPGGMLRIDDASESVFAPNPMPDNYVRDASIPLVLRPAAFHANSVDVEGLYRHVLTLQPRYHEIDAPTVVISGDRDTVVYEEIHSIGLARDIPGAQLVWVHNLGHKPDWIATDLAIAAIETVAGQTSDLAAIARAVEQRLAGDTFKTGRHADLAAPPGFEPSPTA
ncbi:MAG: alpha/beta hydrolase [Mesorhizobium sp.]